jgi:hypothetical protein
MVQSLPSQFTDLEIFTGEWAHEDEMDRCETRISSSMHKIVAFYQAIMPRMEAILEYLNGIELDAMSEDTARLLWLTFSLAEITPSIFYFDQPDMVDGCDFRRFQRIDIPHFEIPGDRPLADVAHRGNSRR